MTKPEPFEMVIPKGPCCMNLRVFGASSMCPDLDDGVAMEPKCRRFGVKLVWDVAGHILKCCACIESEVRSG